MLMTDTVEAEFQVRGLAHHIVYDFLLPVIDEIRIIPFVPQIGSSGVLGENIGSIELAEDKKPLYPNSRSLCYLNHMPVVIHIECPFYSDPERPAGRPPLHTGPAYPSHVVYDKAKGSRKANTRIYELGRHGQARVES
jgi:hypothetical protein